MTFADHLARQAREITEARKRIGQQAADRAEANGLDPDAARVFARQLYEPDCSHERIIAAICGDHRRKESCV